MFQRIKDYFLKLQKENQENDELIDKVICLFKNKCKDDLNNIQRDYTNVYHRYLNISNDFNLLVNYLMGLTSSQVYDVRVILIRRGGTDVILKKTKKYKELVKLLLWYERSILIQQNYRNQKNEKELINSILQTECKDQS